MPLSPATAARQVERHVVAERRDRAEPGDRDPSHRPSLDAVVEGEVTKRRLAGTNPVDS